MRKTAAGWLLLATETSILHPVPRKVVMYLPLTPDSLGGSGKLAWLALLLSLLVQKASERELSGPEAAQL